MILVQPGPELQILIRKGFNEDANTRDASLQAIKDWLAKQPHLPDTWLQSFQFLSRTATPLPGLTADGKRVTVICGFDKNVIPSSIADLFKVLFMVGNIRLGEEKTGVAGDVYVLDAGVVTAAHLVKLTPDLVKKLLTCVQEAYPVILKEIHVVNAHPLVDVIFRLVKPFLKEKIISRIRSHTSGYESLQKFVPKDVLPEEYGGDGGKLQDFHDAWIKKLEEYTPWFKEQENIKADEFNDPENPSIITICLGWMGASDYSLSTEIASRN